MTETRVTVIGELHGAYWWPIGEPWTKDVQESRIVRRGADSYTYKSETVGLRDLVVELVCDGDSSAACRLSADSVLVVERTRGSRTYRQVWPISMFPSIADCIEQEG